MYGEQMSVDEAFQNFDLPFGIQWCDRAEEGHISSHHNAVVLSSADGGIAFESLGSNGFYLSPLRDIHKLFDKSRYEGAENETYFYDRNSEMYEYERDFV
jgi:hypothetical protein